MNRSLRMSDVARFAGVSTMTVSRALNGSMQVTEDTRRKVLAAVEQLGYRRNELARSLRERRSRQIGILIPNLFDPFFALCAHTINTVTREQGYSVSMATTDEDPEIEYNEATRMLQRGVEALLVIPAEVEGTSRLHGSEFASLPIATLDRRTGGKGACVDSFTVENRRGAEQGTAHLLSFGHTHVACVALNRRLYTLRQRIEGYETAMQKAGLPTQVLSVPDTAEATLELLRPLMSGKDRPTGLFCTNNLTTRNVLHALQALGLHLPYPVALVGFDDFETADLLWPGITVVRQPAELMARQAAEAVFARLASPGKPAAASQCVLPVQLVIRGSCGER